MLKFLPKSRYLLIAFLAAPHLLLAQEGPDASYFRTFMTEIGAVMGILFPLLTGVVMLVFIWGVAKMILNAGDEKARADGKQLMFWGIVALFVIVSIWGIVALLVGMLEPDLSTGFGPPGAGL